MTSAVATTAATTAATVPTALVPAPVPPKAPVAIDLGEELAGLARFKVELADQIKAFEAMTVEIDNQIQEALRKAGAEIARVDGHPAVVWGDTNRFPVKKLAGAYPEIVARYTTEQARMVKVFDEEGLARDYPDLHAEYRGRGLRVDTKFRQQVLSGLAVTKALGATTPPATS